MTETGKIQTDLTIVRRCALFIAALAAVVAMQHFKSFLLPTMIGLFLALVLTPVVHAIEKTGISRALSAGVVVLTVLFSFGAAIYAVTPSYEDYRSRAPEILRDIENKIAPIRKTAVDVGVIEEVSPEQKASRDEIRAPKLVKPEEQENPDLAAPAAKMITDVAVQAPVVFGQFLYIIVLTFFTIYDRRRLMRLVLMTQDSFGGRAWIARVIREMRTKVARYLLTISIINVMLGIATAVTFWALGMPNPVLWGVGMAILNFIPYLGPAIMNVIVFAVAFVHYPSFLVALLPVAALLMLNLIEGQIVTPMLIGSRIAVGALPVFLAVAFGAWLWGAVGALLATPALIVGQTLTTARRRAQRPIVSRKIR